MKYYSTNRKASEVSLKEAVIKGLAPDKGLYMPEYLPELPKAFFDNIANMSLQEMSLVVAEALFGDDIEPKTLKRIVLLATLYLIARELKCTLLLLLLLLQVVVIKL